MHAPKMIMSHQRTDRNDAIFFRWSPASASRNMTTDTTKPEATIVAASAAPNQPSVRCTLTLRARTKADCASIETRSGGNPFPQRQVAREIFNQLSKPSSLFRTLRSHAGHILGVLSANLTLGLLRSSPSTVHNSCRELPLPQNY